DVVDREAGKSRGLGHREERPACRPDGGGSGEDPPSEGANRPDAQRQAPSEEDRQGGGQAPGQPEDTTPIADFLAGASVTEGKDGPAIAARRAQPEREGQDRFVTEPAPVPIPLALEKLRQFVLTGGVLAESDGCRARLLPARQEGQTRRPRIMCLPALGRLENELRDPARSVRRAKGGVHPAGSLAAADGVSRTGARGGQEGSRRVRAVAVPRQEREVGTVDGEPESIRRETARGVRPRQCGKRGAAILDGGAGRRERRGQLLQESPEVLLDGVGPVLQSIARRGLPARLHDASVAVLQETDRPQYDNLRPAPGSTSGRGRPGA